MDQRNLKLKQDELTSLYHVYFNPKRREQQETIWRVLCQNYFAKFLPETSNGVLVDVAAGYCNFANNIPAPNYQKFAYDLNTELPTNVRNCVTPIIDEVQNLKQHFAPNSVDIFWQSHFLEHLSKDDILQLMRDEYAMLKPKGQMWILTPNVRYYQGGFWDWYDHVSPLTERSIIEACQLVGFNPVYVEKKFIPGGLSYTKKPTYEWLIKLYLKLMPVSGWFFGVQSFFMCCLTLLMC